MSKDPRAELYRYLSENEQESLVTDVKEYFSAMIGKDDSLKDVEAVKTQLTELKIKFDAQGVELQAAKDAPANKEGYVSVEQFDALKKDFTAEVQKGIDTQETANKASLSTSLDTLLGKIDPITKAGIIGSLKGRDGFILGGKTYKASYENDTTLFTVDGESTTAATGIESLMESGLSSKVTGDTGGGFPAFSDAVKEKALSFDDDINADMKK